MFTKIKNDINRAVWLPVTAIVLILPVVLGDGYYLNVLNFVALYSMMAVGLCLLVGYCGQLSISHSAFFAIGAYSSAVLSLRFGLPPVIAILLSQVISAAIALVIGAIVLRLKGHYLAIATLSFTIIVEVIIVEAAWLTGGLQGLSGIPAFSLGSFEFDTDLSFYYVAWPVLLLLLLFALNLIDSRFGRVIKGIREHEDVVRFFGVDVGSYKVKVFVLSSVYASIAGSLYAHFLSFVSPAVASLSFAIDIIMVLAFGGFTLIWGAMLGALAFTYLTEYLTAFADFKRAAFGVALVVIMMIFPGGLLPGLQRWARAGLSSIKRASNDP